MYYTLKVKEIKPPKGWQFSGDPSFLNLSNNDFNVYFRIINSSVRISMRTGVALSDNENEWKWEVTEHHGQTGVQIQRGRQLSNKEAKEIAVKLAKNLSKKKFIREFVVIVVTAILAGVASYIVSKL